MSNNGHGKVETLEHDVDQIRNNIGELVRELNHRRHEAMDLRLQMHRNPRRLLMIGVMIVGIVAGGIALALNRRRRRHSLRGRAHRLRGAAGHLREAVRRIVAHPERVAERGPSVARKVAAAGGGAIASVLGKRLAGRLVLPR
jgi:hypothetical protein